jgi:hypothetical protein
MRGRVYVVGVVMLGVLLAPIASAAQQQHREAIFPMAQDFEDRLTVVSGSLDLRVSAAQDSAAFFRTSGVDIRGLTRVCWQVSLTKSQECADGPLRVVVPEGSSFGFNSPSPYPLSVVASHSLVTFVDLSNAKGFTESLEVGPSLIGSLLDSHVKIGRVPALTGEEPGGLTLLEDGSRFEVRTTTGLLVHTATASDPPIIIEGTPLFLGRFASPVIVVPFTEGASAGFRPAKETDAEIGLSDENLDVLDDVLHEVRLIGPAAKSAPSEMLELAGPLLTEVFNGAFIRARISDRPQSLGDVAFAKFEDLTVTGGAGPDLNFEGSYTLVVGDLGPSFDSSEVSDGSPPLRWWVGIIVLLAVVVVGAWLWLREGPMQPAEKGPQTIVARVATAIGVVVAFLVWDWQLDQTLGSSMFTTNASDAALGVIVFVELASLALAALVIGVPVYLIARYGLALAKKPKYASLATTAAVFVTLALGVVLLPALVSMLVKLAS